MRVKDVIENWYEVQRKLYIQVAREFIIEQLKPQIASNSQTLPLVNA
jgi:hypothetical protein